MEDIYISEKLDGKWFAYYDNDPIGFVIMLPELNQYFKVTNGNFNIFNDTDKLDSISSNIAKRLKKYDIKVNKRFIKES